MNILYDELPSSICVDGKYYAIHTDYRAWMQAIDIIESGHTEQEKAITLIRLCKQCPPLDLLEESLQELMNFAIRNQNHHQKQTQSESISKSTGKIISWAYDAAYVYAAFLSVYHINLMELSSMHWHIFLSLFDALPEDTPIKQRLYYRSVNLSSVKDKNERKRILKIQQAIRIPQEKTSAIQTGDFFG